MPRSRSEKPDASNETPVDIAIRLLELQQRVAAFGSLYDEEITGLTEELSRLKADFVRHYKSQASSGAGGAGGAGGTGVSTTRRAGSGAKSSRAPGGPARRQRAAQPTEQPPERPSEQPPDRSSAEKE